MVAKKKNNNNLEECLEAAQHFEPKMNDRFIVNITNKDGEHLIKPYVIKSITMPEWDGYNWCHMILKMYDPIAPSTSKALMDLLNVVRNNNDNYMEDNIKINIDILDPTGNTVSRWNIVANGIESINFGKMDWKKGTLKSDLCEVTMELSIKDCILEF